MDFSHVNADGIHALHPPQSKLPQTPSTGRVPIRLTPELYRSAAGRLTRVGADERARAAEQFVQVAPEHGIDLSRTFVTVQRDGLGAPTEVLEACLSVAGAGRTAVLFLSGPDPAGGGHDDRVATIEAVCRFMANNDAPVLAQMLPEPDETWTIRALTEAGFSRVGDLAYLRRPLGGATQVPPLPTGIVATPVREFRPGSADWRDLGEAMERSYEQTLDCPELCGLRGTDDVIASHQAAGEWDPALWWVVREGDRPVGCMLLNPFPAQGSVDLVYLGLACEVRGRGVARALLAEGVARATECGHASMTCAVDRRNVPALRLYKGMGFAEFSGRVAFVRMIEHAERGERGLRT
ncbi:MAG: GNAT family N-acetyltransferase [Planctomycetes bacterium]|nr:GNAT family N-acetyltransferase [Planctomycetota bacterium]